MSTSTAVASPNIAFIKYWGNRDNVLRLPSNGSISMNLAGLFTRTTVSFQPSLPFDELIINGHAVMGKGLERISYILDLVRAMAGIGMNAEVMSENNFPAGAGIASSAAAFAALALASSQAAGLTLPEAQLSRLARRGSGSASRSIPSGFVEWKMGTGDDDCVAESIATPEHWALADCIAIVNAAHKKTGSTEGHAIAGTSPLQNARVADTPRRLDILVRRMMANDKQASKALVPFGALAVDQITSETTAQFSDYLKRAKELSVLPTGSYEYRSAQEPMGYERDVLYQCIRSLCNFDMPEIETFLAKLYHGATMLLQPLERGGLDQNELQSTGIRQSNIWAFEYFGGKEAVDIIISGLQDGDTPIRYAALTTQRSCLTESATITSLSRNPYFSKRLTSR